MCYSRWTFGGVALVHAWHTSLCPPDVFLCRSFTWPFTTLAVIEGLGTSLYATHSIIILNLIPRLLPPTESLGTRLSMNVSSTKLGRGLEPGWGSSSLPITCDVCLQVCVEVLLELALAAGRPVLLVGPHGSGKTTLCKHFLHGRGR